MMPPSRPPAQAGADPLPRAPAEPHHGPSLRWVTEGSLGLEMACVTWPAIPTRSPSRWTTNRGARAHHRRRARLQYRELSVADISEKHDISRITVVTIGTEHVIEQIIAQLGA